MAYLCEFDRYGDKRNDNELFIEWLEHDGKTACEVKYVPERTCKIEPTTCKNEIFIERIHEYECYACNELVPMYINEGRPNYCPHCGAKAVE